MHSHPMDMRPRGWAGPVGPIRSVRLGLVLLAVALLGGCASLTGINQEQAFSSPPPAVELRDVPFFSQEAYHCGPAALAEMLGWSGVPVTPEELAPAVFIPERKGSLQAELIAQTRQHGRVPYQIPGDFDAIIAELEAGNPVMVFQNLALSWWPMWHYAVIVGYDPDRAGFLLRSGTSKRVYLSLDRFRRTWDRGERWAMVVTRPETLPSSAQTLPWLLAAADLEQTGQLTAAGSAYTTGRSQWPKEAGFHLGLVNVHHTAGDLGLAEAAARRGLRAADAQHGVLHNNLAVILGEQQRWDEAEAAAEQAVTSGGRFTDAFSATLERTRCRDNASCLEALSTDQQPTP